MNEAVFKHFLSFGFHTNQVLKALLHGDSLLFREHPELLNALVRVYFHSSLKKYNRIECWGPLKDAVEVKFHMFLLLRMLVDCHVTIAYNVKDQL